MTTPDLSAFRCLRMQADSVQYMAAMHEYIERSDVRRESLRDVAADVCAPTLRTCTVPAGRCGWRRAPFASSGLSAWHRRRRPACERPTAGKRCDDGLFLIGGFFREKPDGVWYT